MAECVDALGIKFSNGLTLRSEERSSRTSSFALQPSLGNSASAGPSSDSIRGPFRVHYLSLNYVPPISAPGRERRGTFEARAACLQEEGPKVKGLVVLNGAKEYIDKWYMFAKGF